MILDKYLKAELLEAEQAVTGAIRTATTGLKNSMRAQVAAAGLGPRLGQSHGAVMFIPSRVKA